MENSINDIISSDFAQSPSQSVQIINSELPLSSLPKSDMPTEVVASGEPTRVKIDEEYIQQAKLQRAEEERATASNEMVSMFKGVYNAEKERLAELEANPENDPNIVVEELKSNMAKVETVASNNASAINYDDNSDLIPSYSDSDEPEEVVAENVSEADDADSFFKEIREMPEVPYVIADKKHIFETTKPLPNAKTVKNEKLKDLGDQAFINHLASYKKTKYNTTRVPMVNSGFMIDMVGTGSVDLSMLYSNVDKNTSVFDYEIDRMKAIIKSVINTEPKIDAMYLANNIHYNDYQIMAFGNLCATLSEIKIPTTCEHCGKNFILTADPNDLLLNVDKLSAKMELIKESNSVSQYSLLANDILLGYESGITVKIGHPTYIDMITLYKALKYYTSDGVMSPIEAKKLVEMAPTIATIKSFTLPTGAMARGSFQIYNALKLLDTSELKQLTDAVTKLGNEVISPEFGFKAPECPHCHKKNGDFILSKIDEMVFFNTMVTQSKI